MNIFSSLPSESLQQKMPIAAIAKSVINSSVRVCAEKYVKILLVFLYMNRHREGKTRKHLHCFRIKN